MSIQLEIHEHDAEREFQTLPRFYPKLHASCYTRPVRAYQVPPMATVANTNVCDYHLKKWDKIRLLAIGLFFKNRTSVCPLEHKCKNVLWMRNSLKRLAPYSPSDFERKAG